MFAIFAVTIFTCVISAEIWGIHKQTGKPLKEITVEYFKKLWELRK